MIVHICDRLGCDERAVYRVRYDPRMKEPEVCPTDVAWLTPFAIADNEGVLTVAYIDPPENRAYDE